MELKRYVMLNNNKVYDLTNEDDFNKYQTVKNGSHCYFQVKKRSDNILDLVEVGDLTEQSYKGQNFLQRIDDNFDLQKYEDDLKEGNGIYYVSIYKRQPNGDYKKYEVQ